MRWALLLAIAAVPLFGQSPALVRLAQEAQRAKAAPESDNPAEAGSFHAALREWVETRLPKNKSRLAVEFPSLQASMDSELAGAGLLAPKDPPPGDAGLEYPGVGFAQVALSQLPELPDTLFVTAGPTLPCGADEAVYAYRFDSNGWKKILEDHPKSSFGYDQSTIELSEPDAQGRHLLLIHRLSVQCQSTWMGMTYSVYRFGQSSAVPETLLSGHHGFWMGNDGPEFVLKPDELIMEFLDASIDVGVHNRTQIHRYSFAAKDFKRLDPIAFQPQDFAEEWLTQPWSVMQSRSEPDTEEWHSKLHADMLFADYSAVVACHERPDRWLIALDINQIGEKALSTPLPAYLLVHDLGNYHYRMESAGNARPAGCAGSGDPSDKHPWLSADELKALK